MADFKELLPLVVEAAARGSVLGGRHCVAAAVAAAIRAIRADCDKPVPDLQSTQELQLDGRFDCITALEEALHAVGGLEPSFDGKMSITMAKKLLRERGTCGVRLAARLGKLSKARNTAAHPDVALISDIKAMEPHSEPDEEAVQTCSGGDEPVGFLPLLRARPSPPLAMFVGSVVELTALHWALLLMQSWFPQPHWVHQVL